MNPELVLSVGTVQYIVLLMLSATFVVGFLIGYLTKNFLIDKQLRELENVLEKETGRTLDDFFHKLY